MIQEIDCEKDRVNKHRGELVMDVLFERFDISGMTPEELKGKVKWIDIEGLNCSVFLFDGEPFLMFYPIKYWVFRGYGYEVERASIKYQRVNADDLKLHIKGVLDGCA